MPTRASTNQHAGAWLLSVGSAVPSLRCSQERIEHELAAAWGLLGEQRDRWSRICRNAEIEHRHAVAPLHEVIDLTTAQRMERFEREAPPIAARAARRALSAAGVTPSQVTDLIIVTCTGFAAPGLDVALVDALELPRSVRRMQVGFMGCFGAVTGLRAAAGACAADPGACALVVCCELCTLHVRRDAEINNQIASALFGDGAAAAIAAGEKFIDGGQSLHRGRAAPAPLGRLTIGASTLLKEGRPWMSWRMTDHGFAMTLAREVPAAVRRSLGPWVRSVAGDHRATIIHPGGPGILDAAAASLELEDNPGLERSRAILRDFGNISSGTVLFVLERVISDAIAPPWLLIAFGPGLTIEALPINAVPITPHAGFSDACDEVSARLGR